MLGKMGFVFILTGLLVQASWASTPNLEGLLRNGSNPDVTSDTVILSFSVKEVSGVDSLEKSRPKDIEAGGRNEIFVKMYLSKNKGLHFLQATYDTSDMKPSSLKSVVYKKDFSESLSRKEFDPDKDIFYATLLALTLNSDRAFLNLFRKTNADYKPAA